MASNAQSAHRLGPSVSLDRGAPLPSVGELVLIRIPEEIRIEGYVENEATAVGTDLSPISTGSGPQHFSFVREVSLQRGGSFVLQVYPVLSFIHTGGALATYNEISAAAKAALLPLPPLLSSRHPTPDAFGKPLDFGNLSTYKDSFLHVFPRCFTMPMKRSFKRMDPPLIMPYSVLVRIDEYRNYLLSITSTQNYDDQSHPPSKGGSGSSNPPHGQTGDGGGQAASRVTSVTSSPTINRDGGGEKAAGAGLEQFSVKSTLGLLVLEDVDEDAEDADATIRDELVMLAHDNPIWMEELRRYLQKEEKEKEQIQNERLARLVRWREDISIQPT